MKSLDGFLDRTYDYNKYNCSHFVAEVWHYLTDEDISSICDSFVNDGEQYLRQIRTRDKIRKPESPCVVIMQAPNVAPHAGVFFENRIVHLTENGVAFNDIHIMQAYYRLSFYK